MQVSIFNENYVRPNSLRAWWLAARPKTLSGAAVPVMIGGACAYHAASTTQTAEQFFSLPLFKGECQGWEAFLLCLLFAWLMQIDSNFINDWWDCKKGRDNEDRLGPLRACQQGWISLRAMLVGIIITTILACLVGLPLIYFGGIEMVYVGVACVVFSALYTVCLAQLGLGDVLVLLFFGIVPVCGTYWCCMPHVTTEYVCGLPSFANEIFHFPFSIFHLSIATGLIVDTLLIVNNYRDIDNDKHSGKKTLVVLIGKQATEYLYICLVTAALLIVLFTMGYSNENLLLCFGTYYFATGTWMKMKRISKGKELNNVLGETARNIFIFGVLTSLLILLA